MQPIFITFAVVLGAVLGSFLNVVAVRTHARKSLGGRSACAACGRTLGPLDLVPVLSYVILRGRCRGCKTPIPAFHLFMELSMAVLFGLAAWTRLSQPVLVSTSLVLELLRDGVAISFLAVLSLTDVLYGELPDYLTWPAVVFCAVFAAAAGLPPFDVILGVVAGAAFFLLQRVLSRGKWVGDADIILGAAIGALLGPLSGLGAILLSYVYGAVIALPLLLTGRVTRKTVVPFVPLLALGAVTVLLFGPQLAAWYWSLIP